MKTTNLTHYLIAIFLLCISGITSCSDKNDSPDIPDVPENPNQPNNPGETTDSELYKSYDTTTNDLISLIQNDGISTNSELVEVARNYDNFVSAEEIEGIQYLYFKGNLEFFVDFNEECSISSEDDIETDDSELNNLMEELENFYSSPINSLSSKASSSRTTNHINYCATSKKILLWCPLDLETESSSINNQINEAIKALKNPTYRTTVPWSVTIKLGNECSVSDFKTFDQYDIVFVIVHGSIKGEPMVPKSFNVKMGTKGIIGKNRYNILTSKFLSDNLPSMPHTVIWTLMCHSIRENSALASVAEAKSVGDFFGASNNVDVSTSIRYFKPFYLRLGLGMNSYEAFSPEGKNFYNYSINTPHGIKEGVFGHNENLNGACFPLQHVRTAENGKPIGVWQTSIGVMAKVKNNNGPFKAGIKLENVDTGESTIKEMSDDNIDSSESKKFGDFFEETTYTFKTDGLEPGTYNYRTYITYPDGTTQYSENQGTLSISDIDPTKKYFELYYDRKYPFYLFLNGNNFTVSKVLCDKTPIEFRYNFPREEMLSTVSSCYGYHQFRIFYEGELEYISSPYDELGDTCKGGYFPFSVAELKLHYGGIKEISGDKNYRGNYILTIPFIKSLSYWERKNNSYLAIINLSHCSDLTTISCGDCSALSSINLDGCSNLTTIYFANSSTLSYVNLNGCSNLTTIEENAFLNCSSLPSIDLSDCSNLTTIGEHAFYGCTSLASIDLSDCSNLTTIGDSAFGDCNLSQITIPSSVKELGSGQGSFRTVYCYPNNPPAKHNPFDRECRIYVPSESFNAYSEAWGEWEYKNGIRTCVNIFPM